ncbi:hypothetical protein [Bradyrhizobium yuanmingense]|nr:hypothetical protein [Bradyrhizobium yuanmingense]
MMRDLPPILASLPGLTRQSIDKEFVLMDARVKPAHDELVSGKIRMRTE